MKPNTPERMTQAHRIGEAVLGAQAFVRETFGGGRDPHLLISHLREELAELEAAILDGEGVAHELADIYILAGDIADALGVDIAEAVSSKTAINRGRTWARCPITGHIKGSKGES